MVPVTCSHIELDERDVAWIAGTATKVREVAMDKIAFGWDAEQIHAEHPHLTLWQIHAALAYYFEHQAAVEAEIEAAERWADELQAAAPPSPFVERLQREGRWPAGQA